MIKSPNTSTEALHELIDHCIQAKLLADRVEGDVLRELADLLLLEAGRLFASEMRRQTGAEGIG